MAISGPTSHLGRLAICNLTTPRGGSHLLIRRSSLRRPAGANFVATTDLQQPTQDLDRDVDRPEDQPETPGTRSRGPDGLGLSGKLLLLTVPLVMIAAVLLYVPAIANFWVNRLN